MVRGHQLKRLWADDLHTVKRAAVEQHPAKTVIVGERRGQPATARLKLVRARPGAFGTRFIGQLHLFNRVPRISGRNTPHLVGGHGKAGIIHAKRRENMLLKILTQ